MSHIHKSLTPMEPRISRLRLIEGEGDPARFARAESRIPEVSDLFFRVGRLTLTYEIQMGVIGRLLKNVSYKPEEQDQYLAWLEMNGFQAAMQGRASSNPPQATLDGLRERDDPLMHIIDQLEGYRLTNMPDTVHDARLVEKAQIAYSLAQASVHGTLKVSALTTSA